jgi:glycosyltransferase involved in cell wall biosynthesis
MRASEGGPGQFGNRLGGSKDWLGFRIVFGGAGLFHGQVINAGFRCPETMKWLCCQLGAREHYAIPRALFRLGMLECLLTDAWVPPCCFLAKACGRRSKLTDRFDNELHDARVKACNSSLILFETLARAGGLRGWPKIVARNRWFQRKVVSVLRSQFSTLNYQPILLSYSYTALEPFRYAKARGWKTLLIQIDPGPEEEAIVAEEAARVPELAANWQPAPAAYWALWREECKLADQIVVNSEWSRDGLIRGGVPGDKLSVIPLAYETPEVTGQESEVGSARSYPARFTPERPMRVLFLGLINLRKGVARLLEAARILRDEPVEFWMVGPVEIANASAIGDAGKVKWFGPATREKAAEYYGNADVFILPTLSDGFAITQLEAQAYGLPLIASRRCGEVVQDNVNGLLLDDPSAEAIESAIRFCLENPNELARFSRCSTVGESYSVARLGERLFAVAPVTQPVSL